MAGTTPSLEKESALRAFFVPLLERLESSLQNEYFLFDREQIGGVAAAWGVPDGKHVLIPVYGPDWEYLVTSLPTADISVDFVQIRRHRGECPDLLEQAWMVHELGHYLLRHRGSSFQSDFSVKLDQVANKQKTRSIPLRGNSARLAEQRIARLETLWEPKITGSSWSTELCVDVIAMWTAGPAFLSAFYHDHHSNQDPYRIDEGHPPVALRCQSILLCAERLGWRAYSTQLSDLADVWNSDGPPNSNAYLSVNPPGLLESCVETTFGLCSRLRLPQLIPDDISRIRSEIATRKDFEPGIPLVVAAWLVDRDYETHYRSWEAKLLKHLSSE